MAEEPTVQAEQTVQEPAPETTPEANEEQSVETPAESVQTETPQATEERPTRSQERISQTIAQRKAAEETARLASEEAAYWKQQALANQQQQPHDGLEGVTEEGIDPLKFAESLEKRLLSKISQAQESTLTRQQFQQELAEVRTDPALKSETAQKAVSRIINSEKVSPSEALEIYKEEMAELYPNREAAAKARNEAGRFVREQTQTPSAGKGSSSVQTAYTREQIDKMSLDEYSKHQEEISDQLQKGLIR